MKRTILTVSEVHKQYSTVKAVDGVSLEVGEGEIFALLGPNGAGKSTLVRMLIGMSKPDSGSVSWSMDGQGGVAERISAMDLGYLPEDRGLYRDQGVLKTLVYFGRLRGMTAHDAREAGKMWLERLQLGIRGKEKLEALSKGNQQKVQFITAVMHKPRVAVLDEPFSGLDPLNQQKFLELLQELRKEGMTIILSAHQMQLVERLADRLLLMGGGKRVLYGTLNELRSQTDSGLRVRVQYEAGCDDAANWQIPGVERAVSVNGGGADFYLHLGADLSEVVRELSTRGKLLTVQSEPVSLHDIYVKALGGKDIPQGTDNQGSGA